MRKMRLLVMILPLLVILSAPLAFAFECSRHIDAAQDAIDLAAAAMAKLPKAKQGLVHTLVDDAKMLLESGKHNCAKPAAGDYDLARGVAKAKSARAYAEAAQKLAKRTK